jgi:sialic acid synthase SpsE
MAIARKSIIASQDIAEGESFSKENITTKRPGTGINPMEWNNVMGTPAKKSFKKDELIEL